MFTFFKSKPALKDLLDGSFVDIHSHLLPGIDDGAKSLAKSIELTKSFQKLAFVLK